MATSAAAIKATYPIPAYHFIVSIIGIDDKLGFSDVSGLEIGYETITYKDGLGTTYNMPGMSQPIKLTLKRGLVKGNSTLYDWVTSVKLNKVEKYDITISLIDEQTSPMITWKVSNAFPTKLTAPNFDAKTNEVAIESLELMADSFTVENKR